MQQPTRASGLLLACALVACGKSAESSDTPEPAKPEPAKPEPTPKSDPLDGVRWGVAQAERVVMLVTLAPEDALVTALEDGKTSDGRRLDDLSSEPDMGKRMALSTPVFAKALKPDAPFSPGKRWRVISPGGTVVREVTGLEVVQDGHFHYLVVLFPGLGKSEPAMTFRRPPATAFELGFEQGFALFVPGDAPLDLHVVAPASSPLPAADKLASLRAAILAVTSPDMKAVLSAATLSPANTRLLEGRFPQASALLELNLTRVVGPDEESIFHCDNDLSIITFVDPMRAALVAIDARSPTLGWASSGALGPTGFSGCGQVLGRVPLGDGFDAFVVEYPFTVGNDVVIYRWDGTRYLGTNLYMQGSG